MYVKLWNPNALKVLKKIPRLIKKKQAKKNTQIVPKKKNYLQFGSTAIRPFPLLGWIIILRIQMEPNNEENLAEMKLPTLTWPGYSHTALTATRTPEKEKQL